MLKACIFDLDGVIVDTAKYHFIAWQNLATSLGIPFSAQDNEALKGVGRMESLEFILALGKVQKTEEEKRQLAFQKNEEYVGLISNIDGAEILDGVAGFLSELRGAGMGIALGSSSKNARFILEKIGLIETFDVVIDGTDTERSKPDPQVFQLGASALGVAPEEAVVFEDAAKGIEAALAGGFKVVGVGGATLRRADFVIPDFRDFTLKDLMKRYNKL